MFVSSISFDDPQHYIVENCCVIQIFGGAFAELTLMILKKKVLPSTAAYMYFVSKS